MSAAAILTAAALCILAFAAMWAVLAWHAAGDTLTAILTEDATGEDDEADGPDGGAW